MIFRTGYPFTFSCLGRDLILANAISTPPVENALRGGGQSISYLKLIHVRIKTGV